MLALFGIGPIEMLILASLACFGLASVVVVGVVLMIVTRRSTLERHQPSPPGGFAENIDPPTDMQRERPSSQD